MPILPKIEDKFRGSDAPILMVEIPPPMSAFMASAISVKAERKSEKKPMGHGLASLKGCLGGSIDELRYLRSHPPTRKRVSAMSKKTVKKGDRKELLRLRDALTRQLNDKTTWEAVGKPQEVYLEIAGEWFLATLRHIKYSPYLDKAARGFGPIPVKIEGKAAIKWEMRGIPLEHHPNLRQLIKSIMRRTVFFPTK